MKSSSHETRKHDIRRIPKSGTPDDVMKYCGLSPEHIAAKVKELVG